MPAILHSETKKIALLHPVHPYLSKLGIDVIFLETHTQRKQAALLIHLLKKQECYEVTLTCWQKVETQLSVMLQIKSGCRL